MQKNAFFYYFSTIVQKEPNIPFLFHKNDVFQD